jgi:hypothetical protein
MFFRRLVMKRLSPFFLALILASGIGCARKPNDAKISSDIQSKFSSDSGLSGKQLTVQASNGVVTLAGFVDNDAQREAAARQAASVAAVKEVVNNLQVGVASNDAPREGTAQANPIPLASTDTRASGKNPRHLSTSQPTHVVDDSSPNYAGTGNPQPPPTGAVPQPADTPPPAPAPPPEVKVTIEQGTPLTIRLVDSIDSEKNQVGDTFHATLNTPLAAEGSEAIPAGTDVAGHVVDVKSSGKFAGKSVLVLQLDTISANGKTYNIQTDQYRKEGSSRGTNTAEKVGGGAIIGGIIGAIAGGGKGAAIGSAAGAGVGGGVQAASKPKPIKLPSETVLNFTLQAPVTVIRANPNAGRQRLDDSR